MKVTDVTLDVVQAQHRSLVVVAVLVFPAGTAAKLVFYYLGRLEKGDKGRFNDSEIWPQSIPNPFPLRTHNVSAGARVSHLIKVIKELQDGEYAGSNEQSHVSTNIAWNKISCVIKHIIHYEDREMSSEYNATQ